MYSVGRYSLWGDNHSTSVAASKGVPPPPQKPTPKSSCPECGKWEEITWEKVKRLWFYREKTIKVCYYCRFDVKPYHEEQFEKWLKQ